MVERVVALVVVVVVEVEVCVGRGWGVTRDFPILLVLETPPPNSSFEGPFDHAKPKSCNSLICNIFISLPLQKTINVCSRRHYI